MTRPIWKQDSRVRRSSCKSTNGTWAVCGRPEHLLRITMKICHSLTSFSFLCISSCFAQSFLSVSCMLRALVHRPEKQWGKLFWQSWIFQLAPGLEAMGTNWNTGGSVWRSGNTFFTVWMTDHRNRLPRKDVEFPYLEGLLLSLISGFLGEF